MKKLMIFRDAPDEGSGSVGAAVFDEPAGGAPAKETVDTAATPAPVVDAKALAAEFGAQLRDFKPAEAPPPKPKKLAELTPEEAEKELNVWKPSKEFIAKFSNVDTQEAAFAELRDGMFKHFDTVTQRRLKEHFEDLKLDDRLGPMQEFMRTYQEDRIESAFSTKYKEIAKPELAALRSAVVASLTTKGEKFQTVDALVDAIAKGMEATIQVTNPNFKLTAGSSPAQKETKGRSSSAIPVTTPGSGGGSAAKGAGPEKKAGLAIFDQ